LFYKTDFDEDEYVRLEQNVCASLLSSALKPLFNSPLAISKLKKQDLMSLRSSKVIPTVYHDFYKSLPCKEDSENVLLNTETETASTTMETQSSDARIDTVSTPPMSGSSKRRRIATSTASLDARLDTVLTPPMTGRSKRR